MGWKVGEVCCGFLFTVPALRGVGSGCLLTVLGRGGGGGDKGESSGGRTIRCETDSKSRRLRADKSESRHGWKGCKTPLPEFGALARKEEPREDVKPHDSFE